jgi:hypothetical protein
MRQVKVVQRFAVVAFVGILGLGAAACGDDTKVTPEAPSPSQAPAAVTTPPTTANPQSGGSGF